MINFVNQEFDKNDINENDIFICALGYERRSFALYDQVKDIINAKNILIFIFDDYLEYDYISSSIEQIINLGESVIITVRYDSVTEVENGIIEMIERKLKEEDNLRIHIDYSSMPRRWYYNLPTILNAKLRNSDQLNFWYVVGKYPGDHKAYPSAGIDSFVVVGKPSLRVDTKRTHVVGLSYDAIRTSAMISILDPSSYIACNAYNKYDKEIGNNVRCINERVISRAIMETSLQIDDFAFMISKLCEIANEFLPLGDVVFVPDGPKPLIFAMSLVPILLDKVGVSCLHVSRNNDLYYAVNVEATERIYGFTVTK